MNNDILGDWVSVEIKKTNNEDDLAFTVMYNSCERATEIANQLIENIKDLEEFRCGQIEVELFDNVVSLTIDTWANLPRFLFAISEAVPEILNTVF